MLFLDFATPYNITVVNHHYSTLEILLKKVDSSQPRITGISLTCWFSTIRISDIMRLSKSLMRRSNGKRPNDVNPSSVSPPKWDENLMRRLTTILFTIALLSLPIYGNAQQTPTIQIYLFYAVDCPDCQGILQSFVPALKSTYPFLISRPST